MQRLNGKTVLDSEDFEPTLKTMPIGGHGWIVPWCIKVDQENTLYLSLNTTYERNAMGTASTQILRIAKDKWRIYLTSGYKFHRGSKPVYETDISYNLDVR